MTSFGEGGPVWPPVAEILAVLMLRGGYNTTIVMLGVTLLGVAAGTVGTFALLRRRALMSDTLSHATLPGICGAFILAMLMGVDGRSLPILLAGAAVSGIAGVLTVQAIARHTRLPEDAAMGAVLSVFFGLGFVLLSHVQTLGTGAEGGIAKFIYGQTAAMRAADALLIGLAAILAAAAVALLFKEFRAACFDPDFAAAQGWPVPLIDLAMMALVVLVTVIGLQAVGLIMIVALIILLAAAARFWTERLWVMVVAAAAIGGASGYLGAVLSALLPRFPAGAVIVLVAGTFFGLSLLLAPARGIGPALRRQASLRLQVGSERLLRELLEASADPGDPADLPLVRLQARQRWPAWWLRLVLARLRLRGLVRRAGPESIALTDHGRREALRLAREQPLAAGSTMPPAGFGRSLDPAPAGGAGGHPWS